MPSDVLCCSGDKSLECYRVDPSLCGALKHGLVSGLAKDTSGFISLLHVNVLSPHVPNLCCGSELCMILLYYTGSIVPSLCLPWLAPSVVSSVSLIEHGCCFLL